MSYNFVESLEMKNSKSVISCEKFVSKKNNLSISQKEALLQIDNFLNTDEYNTLVIKGSAGTGKTYLLKLLTEIIAKKETPFQVCSPTGRSAQVLRSKGINNAITIHSNIYINDEILEEESEGDFIYYFKLRTNSDSINTIYLIDEASMISDNYGESEILRFGSGFLLKDLIAYISPESPFNRKIIFFGDTNQLPPVNSNHSPALDKNYLESMPFNLKVLEIELKEIMRQAENSLIIANANEFKNNLEKEYFSSVRLSYDSNEFSKIDSEKIIDGFCEDYKKDNKEVVLIAYTNNSVKEYNRAIREKLFAEPSLLEIGDRIIVVKNNSLYKALNGEMGIIREVSNERIEKTVYLRKDPEPQELVFRKVKIDFLNERDENREVEALILENLLINSEPTISKKESRALMADFTKRNSHISKASEEYKKLLKIDPFLNCLQIKYGYAITCHKAQGGEWSNVFFDFRFSSNYTSDYYRYCYTGITRAKDTLHAINPPSGGMSSNLKKNSNASEMNSTDNEKLLLIEGDLEDSLIRLINERTKHLNIEMNCFAINYRIRVAYTINQKSVYTDLIYKKNGEITSVQSNDTSDSNTVYKELKDLIGIKTFYTQSLEFGNPFLSLLYEDLKVRLSKSNIQIVKVEHYNFLERYYFCHKSETASINIYYSSKNKVTQILYHKGDLMLSNKVIGVLHDR